MGQMNNNLSCHTSLDWISSSWGDSDDIIWLSGTTGSTVGSGTVGVIWTTLSHIAVPWTPGLGCLLRWFFTVGYWPVEENHKDLEHLGTIQTLPLCMQSPGGVDGFKSRHWFGAITPAHFFFLQACLFFNHPDLLTELCPCKPNVDSAGHTGTTISSWFNATSPALTRRVRYEDDRVWPVTSWNLDLFHDSLMLPMNKVASYWPKVMPIVVVKRLP